MLTDRSLIDDRYEFFGLLGDPRDPWGKRLLDLETGRHVSLTPLDGDCSGTWLSSVADELVRAQSPHLQQFNETTEYGGRLCLLGPVPDGEPLSVRLRRRSLSLLEAAKVGSQILRALECIHPDESCVRLPPIGEEPPAGIIHNAIRPERIFWSEKKETATLVGFTDATPIGPSQPSLLPPQGDYHPADSGELGHHPSIDLFAVAVVLSRSIRRLDQSANWDPLIRTFFDTAMASTARDRYTTASEEADAWEDATEQSLSKPPDEWKELGEQVAQVAQRFQLLLDGKTTLELAHELLRHGLPPATWRDLQALDQVKHDIHNDFARFHILAESILVELDRIEPSR